jgi:hypothetical protein
MGKITKAFERLWKKGMGQGIHEFKKGIRGSIDEEDKK